MILLLSLAWAEAPAPLPEGPTPLAGPPFSTAGEARLLFSLPPAAVGVDDEGGTLGQGPVLDSRLRVELAAHAVGWNLRTEWDLFDAQLAGDPWDIPGDLDARDRQLVDPLRGDAFLARALALDGRLGPVAVDAGLMTSHWGLGMVANDGAHDPFFGRADFGDRVLRLRLATRLVEQDGRALTLVVAGDRVVEDELAEWSPLTGGQAAWQGIASVIWGSDAGRVGLYGVYRHQAEADRERATDAGVIDLYGDVPFGLGGWTVRAAAEGAAILGRTSRAQSYNARDGLAVASAGLTGLVQVTPPAGPLGAVLRGGWASGDGDPDDGASNDFTFDRDFDVGMVLFDELLGAVDAAAYAQIADPEHAGGPPDGAETLVAEGAFRHAAFVQPLVTVVPVPWLSARAGVMAAWNTAPVYQPFTTTRNGGVPTNHLGEPTAGYALGTEVDWALTLGDVPLELGAITTRPALLLQGGHLFAAANLGGGTVSLVTATGRVRW